MQKFKFFMEHLRVSQGYGFDEAGNVKANYSHAGSYALDLGGKDKGAEGDWAYAPCDIVVKRVYGSYNAVWFETLEEVMCADGVARKLVILLIHINDSDLQELGIVVGKTFKQGEKFYREGVAGNVTGAHIHCEVGQAPFTGTGWYQNTHGVWVINNQLKPHEMFILGQDVSILENGGGYKWTVDGQKTEKETVKGLEKLKIGWASSGDLNTLVNMIVAIGGIDAEVKDGYIYTSEMSKGDKETIMQACAELGVPCEVYNKYPVLEETQVTYLVGPLSGGDQDQLIALCQELQLHYELVGNSDELEEEPAEEPEQPEEETTSTEPINGLARVTIGWASGGDISALEKFVTGLGITAEKRDGYIVTGPASKGDQAAILAKCKELGVMCSFTAEAEKNPTENEEKTEGNIPAPEENTPEATQPEEIPAITPENPEDNKEPENEGNGEIEEKPGAGAEDNNVPGKPATDTNVGTEEPDGEPVEDPGDKTPKKNILARLLEAIVAFFKALLG